MKASTVTKPRRECDLVKKWRFEVVIRVMVCEVKEIGRQEQR